jgi:transposase
VGAVESAGTPWSVVEVEQLELMVEQGKDAKEISRRLGRTEGAVQTKLVRLRNTGAMGGPTKSTQRRINGASFFLS